MIRFVENTNYHVLGISLDGEKRKVYVIGFGSEKLMDKAIELFETVTDISVFSVDIYGKSTIDEAVAYFEKSYSVVGTSSPKTNSDNSLKHNPKALVKHIYNSLSK